MRCAPSPVHSKAHVSFHNQCQFHMHVKATDSHAEGFLQKPRSSPFLLRNKIIDVFWNHRFSTTSVNTASDSARRFVLPSSTSTWSNSEIDVTNATAVTFYTETYNQPVTTRRQGEAKHGCTVHGLSKLVGAIKTNLSFRNEISSRINPLPSTLLTNLYPETQFEKVLSLTRSRYTTSCRPWSHCAVYQRQSEFRIRRRSSDHKLRADTINERTTKF